MNNYNNYNNYYYNKLVDMLAIINYGNQTLTQLTTYYYRKQFKCLVAKQLIRTQNMYLLFVVFLELDIGKMMSGEGGLENLFSGGNIMNIFQSINSKIESKVSSEDFKKEDLLGEANDICGTMKDNPLFSSLMGSMQNMGGEQKQPNQPDVKNINLNQNNHPGSSNKTKKRLQKKLQDKKDGLNVEKLNN